MDLSYQTWHSTRTTTATNDNKGATLRTRELGETEGDLKSRHQNQLQPAPLPHSLPSRPRTSSLGWTGKEGSRATRHSQGSQRVTATRAVVAQRRRGTRRCLASPPLARLTPTTHPWSVELDSQYVALILCTVCMYIYTASGVACSAPE